MNQKPKLNMLYDLRKPIFSLLLAVSMLAAMLPQTVQAAVTCQVYHTVREGETKPYIAHTFNVKWLDIAKANDLNPADKPAVGQQLCIPPSKGTTKKPIVPATDTNATIQLTITSGRIYLNLAKFSDNHIYRVKAREVGGGVGNWSRLGLIEVKKNKGQSFAFNVPDDLKDASFIDVCLKDQSSDELICRSAANP